MMKVIILAAGRGKRLGHYTKEIPKPLIDINGKSIIERQIELFKKNGITEIFVVRGYKKYSIISFVLPLLKIKQHDNWCIF